MNVTGFDKNDGRLDELSDNRLHSSDNGITDGVAKSFLKKTASRSKPCALVILNSALTFDRLGHVVVNNKRYIPDKTIKYTS